MALTKPSLDDLRIERKAPAASRLGWWWLVVVVVLLGATAAVWQSRLPKSPAVRTALARESAQPGGAQRTVLNGSGYITARRAATVSSKITGKVVEVFIEEGFKVREGQVLARLDDTNVRASLRLAEAQLQSARTALAETEVRIKEADQELERQAGLLKNKIASQADYDHAQAAALALKARHEQQRADVTVAERQVATWEQQLDDTTIRAPFAGIVTIKNAQPGEMISPISAGGSGSYTRTGICTIVDMQSLEIEVDVSESYINRVEPGQPVEATLDAYPDWKIPCKVIAVIPTADRQKSTVKVRVGFDKLDPRILPEMSAKVAFHEAAGVEGTAGAGRSVVVPKNAVRDENGKSFVFVLQNERVERRAVILAGTNAEDAVVSVGVQSGEKVVLSPPADLREGEAVREQR